MKCPLNLIEGKNVKTRQKLTVMLLGWYCLQSFAKQEAIGCCSRLRLSWQWLQTNDKCVILRYIYCIHTGSPLYLASREPVVSMGSLGCTELKHITIFFNLSLSALTHCLKTRLW